MIDRAPGAHSTGWFRVDRPFGLLSHYTGTPLWPMPPRRAPASVARHSTSWPAGRARLFGIDSHNRGARPATPSEVKFAADLYGAFPVKRLFWVVLRVFCAERERPFFVPSPAIRSPERAEGVKGPKR